MTKRRVIIGICAVVLLAIIGFIVGFITSSPKKPTENIMENSSSNAFVAYQGNSYTLYYPKGWQSVSAPKADGNGTELYIAPQPANESTMAHVTVDILDAHKTSLSEAQKVYLLFNFPEQDTYVAGVPAKKYYDVLTTSEGSQHTIVYMFQKDETIYLLKLGYNQVPTDSQLESEFNQMVSTFVLK